MNQKPKSKLDQFKEEYARQSNKIQDGLDDPSKTKRTARILGGVLLGIGVVFGLIALGFYLFDNKILLKMSIGSGLLLLFGLFQIMSGKMIVKKKR